MIKFVWINYGNVVKLKKLFGGVLGVEVLNVVYFNEFMICLLKVVSSVVEVLVDKGIFVGLLVLCLELGKFDLENFLVVVFIEVNIDDDCVVFVNVLKEVLV